LAFDLGRALAALLGAGNVAGPRAVEAFNASIGNPTVDMANPFLHVFPEAVSTGAITLRNIPVTVKVR
jgi:hypothetical protein